jgi:hypothetical protein
MHNNPGRPKSKNAGAGLERAGRHRLPGTVVKDRVHLSAGRNEGVDSPLLLV